MEGTFTPSITLRMTYLEAQNIVSDLLKAIPTRMPEPDPRWTEGVQLQVTLHDSGGGSVSAYPLHWPVSP